MTAATVKYVIAIKGLAREQSQSLDLIEHGQGRE